MQYDGVNLPLSCIRTSHGHGIGSFLDLIPFLNLMQKLHFNLVQLLPLNDTDHDPSPYNAISNLAFHPIYISLDQSHIQSDELKIFEKLNSEKRVQFAEVLNLKISVLKRIYLSKSHKEKNELYDFLNRFPDLKTYAIYKKMKEIQNRRTISDWPKDYYDKDFQKDFFEEHASECLFFIFLQKLCHEQLEEVSTHAKKLNIELMCDLPILVSPDSVEVFEYPEFFKFRYVAGAPPDEFNKQGQYWGFPIYDWDHVTKSDYLLWKNRFAIMDLFFSHFRIDHILGFFRFFSIPKNSTPKYGEYIPFDEHKATLQGYRHLKSILMLTKMRPIGEDLGTKFKGVDEVLIELGITQTKIIRWERKKNKFIPLEHYPRSSIVSLSNHDISLFLAWWKNHPELHADFLNLFSLKESPSQELFQFKVLEHFHKIPCDYRVNLIQEYLMIEHKYHSLDLDQDRINIPGEINATNWTYFLPVTLENLSKDETWLHKILTLTNNNL